eukprot:4353499-Prymnesium_polylepis.1
MLVVAHLQENPRWHVPGGLALETRVCLARGTPKLPLLAMESRAMGCLRLFGSKNIRSTAKFPPDETGTVASHASLVVSPASALQ